MWPFKRNKFKNLKKEEVQDAIYQLEKQEDLIESLLLEKQEEVEYYLKKGRSEKSQELRLLYAKKITHLKLEMQNHISKGSYLLYNIRLLNKLKEAIEDQEFFTLTKKVSLGNLLQDQKSLAVFLNQALNTKISAEEVLTSADETFSEIQDAYIPSQEIYGIGDSQEEVLSIFDEFEEDIEVDESLIKQESEDQGLKAESTLNANLSSELDEEGIKENKKIKKAQISEEN